MATVQHRHVSTRLQINGVSCMTFPGIHFTIDDDEVAVLLAIDDDRKRRSCVQEIILQHYTSKSRQFLVQRGDAWNAMHRALSGGHLNWIDGDYPHNHTILGGKSLGSHADTIMSLKAPDEVKDIAAALSVMDHSQLRRCYEKTDASPGEEDFEQIWNRFQSIRNLYGYAATENKFVLFFSDQLVEELARR